jgi:hypothetical protein
MTINQASGASQVGAGSTKRDIGYSIIPNDWPDEVPGTRLETREIYRVLGSFDRNYTDAIRDMRNMAPSDGAADH